MHSCWKFKILASTKNYTFVKILSLDLMKNTTITMDGNKLIQAKDRLSHKLSVITPGKRQWDF